MAKKGLIREELGISQQQLADYLGVSRALLSLAEMNERSLPAAALIKAGEIELVLKSKKTSPKLKQFTNKQTTALQKMLQQRRKDCVYELSVAKKKLDKMKLQYQQAANALSVANSLLNTVSNDAKRKMDKLWLEILEDDTLKKMQSFGEAAQMKLQLKIELLEFELTALSAKMK